MKIRFYGSLGEAIGRAVEIDAAPRASVADVRRKLAEAYPNAADTLRGPSTRACIRGTIVGEDAVVEPGDEVEFFPPLSGG